MQVNSQLISNVCTDALSAEKVINSSTFWFMTSSEEFTIIVSFVDVIMIEMVHDKGILDNILHCEICLFETFNSFHFPVLLFHPAHGPKGITCCFGMYTSVSSEHG